MLADWLPGAGLFRSFLEQETGLFRSFFEQENRQGRFRFDREADGRPAGPWGWEDLN
jgi:hypothetical protein